MKPELQVQGDGDVAMAPAPALDPPAQDSMSELDRLKAHLRAIDFRKTYLNSRITALEEQQAVREAKLRELIAKATGFPSEKMDEAMLKALLDELQSD